MVIYEGFNVFQATIAVCVVGDCGPKLKYAWGDALQGTDCPGPDGTPYPR